jgi:glycosyltransferase involved in cell wall biosynthesis
VFDTAFSKATAFGFLTEEEQDLVERRFGLHTPGLVHGIGVELDPASTRPDSVVLPDAYFVCVGRLDANKGSWDIVEMVRRDRRDGGRLEVVFVGEAPDDFSSEPGITFTGFLSEAERNWVVSRSVALIQPSRFESFSMVLTEAWALSKAAIVNAGCPVLLGQATRSDGALPYSNESELEMAVHYLLDNPSAAEGLGRAGRRYVEARYAWGPLMDRYEGLLESVARQPCASRSLV